MSTETNPVGRESAPQPHPPQQLSQQPSQLSPPKKVEPKKRRRSIGSSAPKSAAKPKKPKGTASSSSAAAAAAAAAAPVAPHQPSLPPTHTLIIDNGGDTLKYGWSTDDEPKYLPNVTARLAHQITLLVGDELGRVQNPNSLLAVTRNLERGLICNMGNQTQVWKRLLDLLGVAIPLQSEAATAFGWKVSAGRAHKKAKTDLRTAPKATIPSQSIAVVLLVPPHCPRLLLDQIVYVWMEDFGVAHVGFGTSTVCAAIEHNTYRTSCTVDLGWSSTLIVPTFRKRAIRPEAIRRLPMGGRHLINILKYYMSYRQYNLMDQEHLLKQVLEHLSFVSMQFEEDLKLARQKPSGRRLYDRDYVLPDYQRTHQGQIRIPPALQRDLEQQVKENNMERDDNDEGTDEEDDEDFEAGESGDDDDHDEDENLSDEDDGNKDRTVKKKSKGKQLNDLAEDEEEEEEEDNDDDDDEDQTLEQRRQQLLKQRAEDERRRREQEDEEQVLRLSVERFAIPEILFRPSDAGFPSEIAGLAPAIVQSIQACPEHFHAALYQSIRLVGGLSKIPNIALRLDKEVRALTPTEYEVKIEVAESPIEQAWLGAKRWITEAPYTEWSISREEWESAEKRKAYTRLLFVNGGVCV